MELNDVAVAAAESEDMHGVLKWATDKMTPGALGIFGILATVIVAYFQLKPKIMALGISQTAEFQQRMLKRIADLELAGVEREKQHSEELAKMRREFDEEREELREEIRGLHRQLLQMAQSSGTMAVLQPTRHAPSTTDRLIQTLKDQEQGAEE